MKSCPESNCVNWLDKCEECIRDPIHSNLKDYYKKRIIHKKIVSVKEKKVE